MVVEAVTELVTLDDEVDVAVMDSEADGEAVLDGDTLGEAEMQTQVYSLGAPHAGLQQISPRQGVTEGLLVREAATDGDIDGVGSHWQ